MRTILRLAILSAVILSVSGNAIAQPYYWLLPGTVSHRTGEKVFDHINFNGDSVFTELTDPDNFYRQHYQEYPFGHQTSWNSGAYTSNGRTNGFDELTLVVDNKPDGVITRDSFNVTPTANKLYCMNARLAKPHAYINRQPGDTTKYPLLIFFHGLGEAGKKSYAVDAPEYLNNDHNIYHGGREFLTATNANPTSQGFWPGFVLVPQNDNNWNNTVMLLDLDIILDSLLQQFPIDKNRIYLNGLSNGAHGVYEYLYDHPDLIAAAVPMSGLSYDGYEHSWPYIYNIDETIVHVPLWQTQGATDNIAPASVTEAELARQRAAGATPRYTKYAGKGHGIWIDTWKEPDFYSWLLQYSKLTIHSYYGVTEVCEGDNQRLGISPGFAEYRWQKSLNKTTPSWVDIASAPGRPNEVLVSEAGLYRVKFRRVDDGWTTWSEPFELSTRPRPQAHIQSQGSWTLFGLDNNTSLTLNSLDTGVNYQWYKNGSPYASGATTNSINLGSGGAGDYTMRYTDQFQCTSTVSEPIYVNRAPFSGTLPASPSNLNGVSSGVGKVSIWWNDNADNEVGYEIYHSLDGTHYTWLANTGPDAISYDDINLPSGTVSYRIRAFNENGPSGEPTPIQVVVPDDNTPPGVPQNFHFERFAIEEHRTTPTIRKIEDVELTVYDEYYNVHLDTAIFVWDPVPDQTQILYDVYTKNGTLITTTSDTSYAVPGLQPDTDYSFYVKARDINGNSSSRSQVGQVFTKLNGLYEYHYEGDIWDKVKDYSISPVLTTDHVNNFDIPTNNNIPYRASDFIGYIYIDNPGTYRFYTRSDDGSSLWIGNKRVVNNDSGVRSNSIEVNGDYTFPAAGAYPITVKYYQRVDNNELIVYWRKTSGTGMFGKQTIPDAAFRSSNATAPSAPPSPASLAAMASSTEYDINLSWNSTLAAARDVVILGSSTAAGTGADPDSSWVDIFTRALKSQNTSSTVTNLAVGGYTTNDVIPSGNATHNITYALSLHPDFIIVNLPSNDAATGIPLSTTMSNFQTLKNQADAQNVEIFFTTSQPRNLASATDRQRLRDEAQAIRDAFEDHVIDTYDELATSPSNMIKTKYNVDGTHVNNLGHAYIYSKVVEAVGGRALPVFEIFRGLSSGGTYEAVHTSLGRAYTDSNLNGGTQYFYKVRAVTSAGASGYSNVANATTIGDTSPPTAPTNFTSPAHNSTQVLLSWTASTDNIGVDHYEIEELTGHASNAKKASSGKVNNAFYTTGSTSYLVTGLTPAQNYIFTVRAYDAAGNVSPDASPTVSVSTTTPLPVEFLFVTHALTNQGVYIKWATATELNNAYFTVERGTGLDNFEALGGVDGHGTSTERHDYSFTDTHPLPLAYYRIKQTDLDGKSEYSKIIRVVYNDDNLPEFSIYPNPTTRENINATGYVPSTESKVLVRMLDITGRVHLEKELDPNEFLNGVKIDLDRPVAPGVYIIMISDGSQNTQRRVVIR